MATRKTKIEKGTTDYMAINSPSVARVMRGGKWYRREEFRSGLFGLGSFWCLMGFMLRSIFWRIPGQKTKRDVIKFKKPSTVVLHAEGEYENVENVRKIEVSKPKRSLKVVRF